MAKIDKIPFRSPEGQQLLQESTAFQTLLIRLFKKQENNTFCGIQTSALLLSAQHFGKQFSDPAAQRDCTLEAPPYLEGNMFDFAETKAVMDFSRVDVEGCTMPQVYNLLQQHGRKVTMYHADTISLQEFRSLVSGVLSHKDSSRGVIANYDEYDLQQDSTVHGHFSPLAAYHAGTDRLLLLDTWMNTVDVWVKTEDLYKTMITIDSDTKKYRGFIILEG